MKKLFCCKETFITFILGGFTYSIIFMLMMVFKLAHLYAEGNLIIP